MQLVHPVLTCAAIGYGVQTRMPKTQPPTPRGNRTDRVREKPRQGDTVIMYVARAGIVYAHRWTYWASASHETVTGAKGGAWWTDEWQCEERTCNSADDREPTPWRTVGRTPTSALRVILAEHYGEHQDAGRTSSEPWYATYVEALAAAETMARDRARRLESEGRRLRAFAESIKRVLQHEPDDLEPPA